MVLIKKEALRIPFKPAKLWDKTGETVELSSYNSIANTDIQHWTLCESSDSAMKKVSHTKLLDVTSFSYQEFTSLAKMAPDVAMRFCCRHTVDRCRTRLVGSDVHVCFASICAHLIALKSTVGNLNIFVLGHQNIRAIVILGMGWNCLVWFTIFQNVHLWKVVRHLFQFEVWKVINRVKSAHPILNWVGFWSLIFESTHHCFFWNACAY